MDSKEARINSNLNGVSKNKKRRRGFGVVLSCFGAGSVEDDVITGSRGNSLAVVPVETSTGESDRKSITDGDGIVGKKERRKETNCRKSFKDKSKGTNFSTKRQQTGDIIRVYHVASHLKSQTEPEPLYRMLDPVETQTLPQMNDSGSLGTFNQTGLREIYEESAKENGYGPSMGLCVLTTALAMMVFCGLTLGVICMSVWFSILYIVRRPGTVPVPEQVNTSEKKSEEVNLNSEEYKRRVVLQGFLERDKRKSLKETKGEGV